MELYSRPIVLTPVGSVSFCCDYRDLNTKSYPIPRQEDLFDNFNGSEIFSVLDLSSAYWHIQLGEEDREKTAFVLPNGKYEVTPYGLKDAALKDINNVKTFNVN